jgi:hypothetical protein
MPPSSSPWPGLLLAAELDHPAADVIAACLQHLLVGPAGRPRSASPVADPDGRRGRSGRPSEEVLA